tara:strand:+ start:8590 stop:8985 length:396 start_codon:yes stop_codon:yes gene_type:complete
MAWLEKGKKLYSIFNFKCPHCHEGDFFKSKNPYDFKNMSANHDRCPNCDRRLSLEPGFYYGAMYVSYALGVAHVVTFWVASLVLGVEMEFWNFIILVGVFLLLLTPLYYALSKIIWANMFFNFKGIENEKS